MVLGGAEWDRKDFPESNLHVRGRDDTNKFNRSSSGINLVLSSTLHKFIVWATWARAQSYFGPNPISVLTKPLAYNSLDEIFSL